jgi:hypothetical protein
VRDGDRPLRDAQRRATRAGARTIVNGHTRNGYCDSPDAHVPFRRYVPLRRRIMEGLLAATSLVLLWLIILAIDRRSGEQVVAALKSGIAANGGVAMQLTDTASHVTRSAWELSFVYGPLMTFAAVAAVLLIVFTRTAR